MLKRNAQTCTLLAQILPIGRTKRVGLLLPLGLSGVDAKPCKRICNVGEIASGEKMHGEADITNAEAEMPEQAHHIGFVNRQSIAAPEHHAGWLSQQVEAAGEEMAEHFGAAQTACHP
ncbi:MAG: hypothetical protein RBR52_13005 [Thiomonas sp.]|nr:hypothetical protein [Thiomonas sp.]MDY0331393.1 hypothetical protein [Thiomonas sp.]